MARSVQVILATAFLVTVASHHADEGFYSPTDGYVRNYRDVTTKKGITVSASVASNGDLGVSISGSAARPPGGAIRPGRPRPTVNDVINALQNLTTKKPDDISNVPTIKPVPLPVYPTDNQPPLIHDTGVYPTVYPMFPEEVPVQPTIQPIYPGQQPIYQPGNPTNNPLEVVNPGAFPNQPIDMHNQSIIILNLDDLHGLQYGGSSLQQLLTILNGKPGFVFVMTGGQGKFIPLNQLHLLPQNSVPSYVVLLTHGRPNPFPGLQHINGLLSNGDQGNLGFKIPNLGKFASLPIYMVKGYYPIWTILSNLGLYRPGLNPNLLPRPDPTPYPNIFYPTSYPVIDTGSFKNPAATPWPIQPPAQTVQPLQPTQPTNPPVVVTVPQQPINVDLSALLGILNDKNNDEHIAVNTNNDVSDSELIKILLQVLNEKPGSEVEHVIIKEKRNPTKLLRILIELLCKKVGTQQVVVENKNENNPTKLLQILIQLLRQKNGSGTVLLPNKDNSEQRLIQLLIKLIHQKDNSHVVVSPNNDANQAQLMNILIQLLGNQEQMNNVLISSQNNGQSQLIQYLIQLLGTSNPEAGNILVSGYNDGNSAQRLYNILLQMISSMPGVSNVGGNTIYLNGGNGFSSGISSDSLMQLVQILLKQQQSNPTVIFKNRQPNIQSFINRGSNPLGSNSKILTMLLGSGGGNSSKSALWSYLLGNFGCMNHNGFTLLCAK